MVGHELEGDAALLRNSGSHALPVVDDSRSEGCWHDMGRLRVAVRLVCVSLNMAEKGQAAFRDHRYQVDLAGAVIVVLLAACHGGVLCAGVSENLLS